MGASLESMYVTPDLSGVGNEIHGAAAQPLGAKIEIFGVAAQGPGALGGGSPLSVSETNSYSGKNYIVFGQRSLRRYIISIINATLQNQGRQHDFQSGGGQNTTYFEMLKFFFRNVRYLENQFLTLFHL